MKSQPTSKLTEYIRVLLAFKVDYTLQKKRKEKKILFCHENKIYKLQ